MIIFVYANLMQGYKALLSWKELCQDQFNIWRLVEVLRQSNMEDIAEAATGLLESWYYNYYPIFSHYIPVHVNVVR